ncbi:PRC and DUF2382 domain-containing protein [Kitasatospora sp. A2-31]|uniref:PRC and DUF2382 domain-containing protein n=1 Tax=Kitasatospora sp. A2-31 TaxID=2916414 RepID=UPI001EEAA3A0|nr:PRC and DUF2382 domain-containing protein [Kitasatospora sp. A2-31]MCG6498172.1 PRC and DUF2382 domain-containing protein [Kitasatospora sp. A2-31]
MQTDIDPRDLIGHKAVDRNGDKIGTVDEVYLDDATGQPEWAAVRTGIFGRDAFVPLTTSEFSGDELRVPYDKSLVKESPDFGVGQHLSPAQELQLYRYYGLDTAVDGGAPNGTGSGSQPADLDFGTVPAGPAAAAGTAAAAAKPAAFHPDDTAAPAHHTTPAADLGKPSQPVTEAHVRTLDSTAPASSTAAPTTPAAPEPRPQVSVPTAPAVPAAATTTPDTTAPAAPLEITCREERLDITTEWHVLGTAKLRKYVTSEPVERRVPVVRERVRVERMPVGDAERAALSDKELAEAVEEVTLREERPVVRKYLAPVERVRLVVERYTAEEVVRDELRREQVEVHDDTVPAADRSGPSSADAPSHPAPLRPLA